MFVGIQRRLAVLIVGIVFLSATNNCFAQQSKVASNSQDNSIAAQPSVDLSGCWYGSWVSCKNGHNGRLSATFCRINQCQVKAKFKGTFAKVIPFRYPATLMIVEEGPGYMKLSGSQRLGPLMGTFRYSVTITPDRFEASYQAKRDWGRWSLSR